MAYCPNEPHKQMWSLRLWSNLTTVSESSPLLRGMKAVVFLSSSLGAREHETSNPPSIPLFKPCASLPLSSLNLKINTELVL